jgi:Recombination endonuclease VII
MSLTNKDEKRVYDKTYRKENLSRYAVHSKSYRAANPSRIRITKLKQNYGLSKEDAVKWAARTQGFCDVCSQPETVVQNGKVKPLALDHCHGSKTVRGVLCSRCNIMLGYYEKHVAFPSRIECFDVYLKTHKRIQPFPWETL